MTTRRDLMERLRRELAAAREQMEAGEAGLARGKLLEVQAAAAEAGAESAYVLFELAETWRAAPETSALERAFELCSRAVQLDPIHPAHQHQFVELATALRQRLVLHSREPKEPDAPRLYATLLRAGEADPASHVAMARHHAGRGQHDEAMRLLEATVLLEPARRDAWELMAQIDRERGNEAAAAGHASRAEALAELDAPYGVPAPGLAC